MATTVPYPATVVALAALGLLGALLAVVGGLLLAGTEGLFKARLAAEAFPSANGAGAITLDLLLAGVAVWLCVRFGRRPFASIWREATRGERIAWLMVGGWLV